MPSTPQSPNGSRPTPPLASITERVVSRLAAVGQAFDRRNHASRPRAGRKRAATAPAMGQDAGEVTRRERACLRSVFRELGDAHRQYRTQTGRPGTPALREAAYAFKRQPSVGSLVPVAALLDELGILTW
jgi:hypothetical protein